MDQIKRVKEQKVSARKGVLSEDAMSYYKRANENFIHETWDDPENKSIFLLNIFRQLKTEAIAVCQNQTVSHYVETFLKNAEPKHLLYMWRIISSNWMAFCTDRCASHIVHKTLLLLPITFDIDPSELLIEEEEEGSGEEDTDDESGGGGHGSKGKCKKDLPLPLARESFLQFCRFLDENLETFITDVYASHIVRVSLHVLANRPMKAMSGAKGQKFQNSSQEFQLKIVNGDVNFLKWFFKLSKHICALEDIYSYFTHKLASPVIQVLVQLTMELDKEVGKKLCRRIIKLCGFLDIPPVDSDTALIDSSRLPDLMMNPVGSYLAEELLRTCPDDLYLTWYECSFKDRLIAYAVNAVSSYVLHLVIDHCVNKDMLKVIYVELEPHIEDILALNHMGVVKSLANICLKFGCKQKKFVNSLMNAFHCSEEEKKKDFTLLLLTMKTYDKYYSDDSADTNSSPETNSTSKTNKLPYVIDNHGSMLIQTLLKFSSPQILVSGFLSLSPELLLDLACQFQGQYIMKQFFESATVSEKDKDDLLHLLHPLLLKMAFTRFGSRSCQSMWPHFTIDQKVKVADELAKKAMSLRRHLYGGFVFYNLQLDSFMHTNKKWRTKQSVKTTKRKIFADILDENQSVKVSNEGDDKESENCGEKSSSKNSQPKKKLKSSHSKKAV